jgi:uncharacterized protein (DUF58 family)
MKEPAFHPLKPRNVLVFAATLALFLGVFLGNSALLVLASVALGGLVMGFMDARRVLDRVEVIRIHAPRAFQGSSLQVSLRIRPQLAHAPELLLVTDEFPPGSTHRFRYLVEESLSPDRLIEFDYTGSCDHRRGRYILGPVRLEGADGLGLFPNEVLVGCFSELVVYPRTVELTRLNLLGDGVRSHVGLETSRRLGTGEEFVGVRDYRIGDPQRLIHWRSTARHGRLMVKEFQEEITTLITIFLDLGRLGLTGVGDQTSIEYSVRACASVAQRAIDRGHALQFFGVGARVEHLPPGSGTAQLLAVLDRLSFLKAEGDSSFPVVFRDLALTLPAGGTAVAILSVTAVLIDPIEETVRLCIERRILPVLILIDDRGFVKVFHEQEMQHLRSLTPEEMEKRLTLAGAQVHVIRRARNPDAAILEALDGKVVVSP